MLRTLKHAFNSPRLIGVKATSAGGACTVNISSGDIASAASASTGKAYLTLGDVFNRPGVCVGSPFQSVGAAGAVLIDADPAIDVQSFLTHDGTSADDGAFNAFILGYDSQDADYLSFSPFTVKNAWNSARLETFKVTPHATTPAINIGGSKGTLTRNGVGDYTITFKRAFSSDNVIAVGTNIRAAYASLHIVSCSATAVRVQVCRIGVASDADPFYLVVQGSDNPEIGYRGRKVTKISDRLPRLIAGHIAYSGGTPSIVRGTGDFTIVDSSTGALEVTFTKAFAREPIVIANQNSAGNVTINGVATTALVNLLCSNGAGAATDPSDLHFMVFGYDDAEEYGIL